MFVDFGERLVTLECVTCSVTFAITATVERQLRASQRTFYCPNDHPQSYKGVLEVERLQAEIARLQEKIADRERQLALRADEIAASHKQNAALRGVITRMKKARKR